MRIVRSLPSSIFLAFIMAAACTAPAEPPAPAAVDAAEPAPDAAPAPAADLASAKRCDPGEQCNYLLLHRSERDFSAWTLSGVAIGPAPDGDGAAAHLLPTRDRPLPCAPADIDGGAASYSPEAGLCAGQDPLPPGSYVDGASYYNGGAFFYGTMISPPISPDGPIDHLIASWNGTTPAGTWLEVHARARRGERWTRWYSLGVWASDFSTIRRHSVDGQGDADGGVDTDTLSLKGEAAAYQLRVTLFSAHPPDSPTVRLVSAQASRDGTRYQQAPADRGVWGTELPVPGRSQALPEYRDKGYGGGGEVWCSPTSTSMAMAHLAAVLSRPALSQTVPAAAAGCYDAIYKGTGNWPFNTAYAASHDLTALVVRLDSMSAAEAFIKAGLPIIISIAFKEGELPGAPISKTNGHLIVVRGFDAAGDVIVNDPAGPADARVRFVYGRTALEAAWSHSHRTAYVIAPRDRALPLPL